ncbi:hypothetical protein D3C85_1628960 [compost metagenome]
MVPSPNSACCTRWPRLKAVSGTALPANMLLPLMPRLFEVKGRLTLLDRRTSWISCGGISRTKRDTLL